MKTEHIQIQMERLPLVDQAIEIARELPAAEREVMMITAGKILRLYACPAYIVSAIEPRVAEASHK